MWKAFLSDAFDFEYSSSLNWCTIYWNMSWYISQSVRNHHLGQNHYRWFKGLIMDRCVLLTSTLECVVSPHRAITRAQQGDHEGSPRDETIHEGVGVNNSNLSMINPEYNIMPAIAIFFNQYTAYLKQIKVWVESNHSRRCHVTT